MKRLHLIFPLWFVVFAAMPVASAPAQALVAREITFKVGEADRRAVLVNEATEGQIRPVVIVLHGGRGSAAEQQARTGFDDLARTEGFAVVYAEGTQWAPRQHAWNTGYLLRQQVGAADDIAYLDTLITLLTREHRADPARVYMTGGSNGAMMTLVYAVRRPERLAAIAPVVGAMFSFDVRPSVPLPVLFINGGADNEVPIEGGMSRNDLVRGGQAAPFKPLEDTVAFWVAANRSDSVPVETRDGAVTTRSFRAGRDGADTVVVVDAVGGHGWPGTPSLRADNLPIQAFKGAERVWAFFRDKRREAGVPGIGALAQPPRAPTALPTDVAVAAAPARSAPAQGGEPAPQRPAGALPAGLDADGDGAVTRAEWLAAGRREQGFAFLDSDRNGSLDPRELRSGLERLRQGRSQRSGGGSRP